MASPLSDLDELVLRCRDEKAKSYIRESVACYKAGAFRSAIVSTWIAVSFDIIDKLKDLALTGDKEAEKQLEEFEKARQAGDIAKSLKLWSINDPQRRRVETDCVPKRVPKNLFWA